MTTYLKNRGGHRKEPPDAAFLPILLPANPALTGLWDSRIRAQADFVRVSDSPSSCRSRSWTLRRAVYAHRVLTVLVAFWNCRETRASAKRPSWASSCCRLSRSNSPRTWMWGGSQDPESVSGGQPAPYGQHLSDLVVMNSGLGDKRSCTQDWIHEGLTYLQIGSTGLCSTQLKPAGGSST